ncbi:two-component sensor histidine kinase [Oceanobacillus arenosus]|uniref:histidine kinase n=1 Tax=Oceanobacillus arenosus TaxID=1229153 RepID=A0A3D8Q2J1_9BACI|nr:HAMP domain-containing sensor histidine kinase [Oceanobacillus arenosus]RDW22312.1 two-component sensor histidine kinase [Oceanobacillus arenosus]
MSIRLRLLLSYIAMIIIPVVFSIIMVTLVSFLFRGDIKEIRDIYFPSNEPEETSIKESLMIDTHQQSMLNSEQFLDQSFLKETEHKLNQYDIRLVVRKGKQLIYVPPSLENKGIKDVPPFDFNQEMDAIEEIDHQFVTIKPFNFYFPDKTEGTLFFIQDVSNVTGFVRTFFPIIITLLLIILIATNSLLTYYMSRSIIRPIRKLQTAASLIKEGNLNVEIKAESKDELGQLAKGFEEMRVRLKESIDIQVAYENNRKELIANISHDLKTPITSIKGYVEGIRDGVANSQEKMDRYIQTIYLKSNDLDHMIDQLFLYSKLDLQRLPFQFEWIKFDQYLRDFVEELRFDVEEMKVNIHLTIDESETYAAMVDREQMKRVITNIVDNSLKYNDKEEKVLHFYLSVQNSHIFFKLEDNGPGINEKSIPHIFDQFYRADLARGTEKGGSGLGLSISKRIIEEHQGTIWAENNNGQGITILFTIKKAGEKG